MYKYLEKQAEKQHCIRARFEKVGEKMERKRIQTLLVLPGETATVVRLRHAMDYIFVTIYKQRATE